MRTPRLLMGAALLFWGWENGMLLWAALMAGALEGSRFSRTRWEFNNADLNRISDLCVALFLGTALLLYSKVDRLVFVFKLAQWLPVCFFPLMLAQTCGSQTKMPMSVFWWLLRRSPNTPTARRAYNISYPYFAVCVLGASAATQANHYFYAGVSVLIVLALTSVRPRRASNALWVVLVIAAVVAGQFSHRQLQRMQNAMEGVFAMFLASLLHSTDDARECRTRIGEYGRIAQSSRIVLRVRPEPGGFVPGLLREATWDAYKTGCWLATNNDFSVTRVGVNDSVHLLPPDPLSSEIEIARYYENGEGTLDLPQGAFRLDDILCPVKTNRLGVATFEDGPGLLVLRASFGPSRSFDSPPLLARDLAVPKEERPALKQVIQQLKLGPMNERHKISAIQSYFSANFIYTLNLPRHPSHGTNDPTPLAYFLTKSHAGHCEYFATATVLLLREAGIPARYVTGYAVPENSRRGDTYLVRERDSHSWALAYVTNSGTWEQLDTTPPEWRKDEAASPPWWQPASDELSDLYFDYSKWRWSKTSYAHYSGWLVAPMILYLAGRILFTRRRQKSSTAADVHSKESWPGVDSELYLINRELAAAQLSRLPNEPLQSWQQRLEATLPDAGQLRRIFDLHRILRFDPRGLGQDDRETLRREASQWISGFSARMEREKKQREEILQGAR